ncbi:MAG TPA: heptaprenyl diphosphate synthase component 1 [Planococcus sp. (in: firmicutes)]|nr:heptaprenyl diphosphate synthase component 1 [Planococcus sp. (in: firmicutes)]
MNDQQIHSKILTFENDVRNAVKQRTLEKFMGGPSIERARLFFLLLPLFDNKQWSGEIEVSAKTVSIVYAALNAHDKIKEEPSISKKQQLTVLAGDFYSGIYYQMLTNLKNLKLTSGLARSITRVSEEKTSFHDTSLRSVLDVEDAIQIIESDLLVTFYEYYGFTEYRALAETVLKYNRYYEELQFLKANEPTQVLRLLSDSLISPFHIEDWLMRHLDILQADMLKLIDNHSFNYELKNYLLHQITPHQHKAEQLTQEG